MSWGTAPKVAIAETRQPSGPSLAPRASGEFKIEGNSSLQRQSTTSYQSEGSIGRGGRPGTPAVKKSSEFGNAWKGGGAINIRPVYGFKSQLAKWSRPSKNPPSYEGNYEVGSNNNNHEVRKFDGFGAVIGGGGLGLYGQGLGGTSDCLNEEGKAEKERGYLTQSHKNNNNNNSKKGKIDLTKNNDILERNKQLPDYSKLQDQNVKCKDCSELVPAANLASHIAGHRANEEFSKKLIERQRSLSININSLRKSLASVTTRDENDESDSISVTTTTTMKGIQRGGTVRPDGKADPYYSDCNNNDDASSMYTKHSMHFTSYENVPLENWTNAELVDFLDDINLRGATLQIINNRIRGTDCVKLLECVTDGLFPPKWFTAALPSKISQKKMLRLLHKYNV